MFIARVADIFVKRNLTNGSRRWFFQTGKCCLTFQQLWVWKGPVKMKRIEMLRRRMTTDNSTGHRSLDYFAATAVNLHVLGTTSSEWRDLLSWTAIMESGLKKNHTRIIEQVWSNLLLLIPIEKDRFRFGANDCSIIWNLCSKPENILQYIFRFGAKISNNTAVICSKPETIFLYRY